MPSPCSTASRCIDDAGIFVRQRGEFEIVGREQGEGAILVASSTAQAQPATARRRCWCRARISSHQTSEASDAVVQDAAVSCISTMNVERPPARSSEAPMRENIRSNGPSSAVSPGT